MEKHENMPRSYADSGKTCGFIPGKPRQTLNMAFHFIRMPSSNVPEMSPLYALFSQINQTVTIETMTVRNILTSVLATYFQVP